MLIRCIGVWLGEGVFGSGSLGREGDMLVVGCQLRF